MSDEEEHILVTIRIEFPTEGPGNLSAKLIPVIREGIIAGKNNVSVSIIPFSPGNIEDLE